VLFFTRHATRRLLGPQAVTLTSALEFWLIGLPLTSSSWIAPLQAADVELLEFRAA
jgi:hypothetical protein